MAKENKLYFLQTKEGDYAENAKYLHIEKRVYKYDPKAENSFHWHDCFEIEFFWEGDEGIHILNGESMNVRRGTMYMITPADFHTMYRKNGDGMMKYFNVNFNEYALSEDIIRLIGECGVTKNTEVSEEECEFLYRDFKLLYEEYNSDNPFKEMMMRTVFEKILLTFFRALERNVPENKRIIQTRDGNVRHIVNYLHLHFREPVSLLSVSREVHLTPNYIGEIFRKEVGVSFTDYVQRLRLNYATNLLACSDLSVAEISFKSGFHSVSYFIKSFRTVTGRTPLEYRNSVAEKSKEKKN
ncbi:MAG: helix-turn-helix domain-containing protein [Ruminococcaceae bacterium]|nr:helix-turn-helix domain-containing protein [Oscillospiraceae bacterium]